MLENALRASLMNGSDLGHRFSLSRVRSVPNTHAEQNNCCSLDSDTDSVLETHKFSRLQPLLFSADVSASLLLPSSELMVLISAISR